MNPAFVLQELVNLSDRGMKSKSVLTVGVIGTFVTAICCFTPALVVLMGVIGLSTWLAWLDYILIPILVLFTGITIVALVVRLKGNHDGIH